MSRLPVAVTVFVALALSFAAPAYAEPTVASAGGAAATATATAHSGTRFRGLEKMLHRFSHQPLAGARPAFYAKR